MFNKKPKSTYLDSEIAQAKEKDKQIDLEIELESLEVTIATKKLFLEKIRTECFTAEKLEAYMMVHNLPGMIPIQKEHKSSL